MPHNLQLPPVDTHSDPYTDYFEARDGILERHFYSRFLGIKSSLLRLEYCLVFYPNFSVLQDAIQEKLKFSCFADFFVCIFKTWAESGFLWRSTIERLWIAWSKRLESVVKLMSKNSFSGSLPSRILFGCRPVSIERDWLSAADKGQRWQNVGCTIWNPILCLNCLNFGGFSPQCWPTTPGHCIQWMAEQKPNSWTYNFSLRFLGIILRVLRLGV
jgi:hypothetical protein